MAQKVAFIGLGVMGYPMAGHLQQSGYQVCVYNRTQVKARQWAEQYAGSMAETPAEAARDAEIVLSASAMMTISDLCCYRNRVRWML